MDDFADLRAPVQPYSDLGQAGLMWEMATSGLVRLQVDDGWVHDGYGRSLLAKSVVRMDTPLSSSFWGMTAVGLGLGSLTGLLIWLVRRDGLMDFRLFFALAMCVVITLLCPLAALRSRRALRLHLDTGETRVVAHGTPYAIARLGEAIENERAAAAIAQAWRAGSPPSR